MKYKTILVDLDDTLIIEENSAYLSFLAAADYLYKIHGINREDFVAAVRESARELWYGLPTINYAREIGISSWEALWADFLHNNNEQRQLGKCRDYYRKKTWCNALLRYDIKDEKLALKLSSIFINCRKKRHVLFDDALILLKFLNYSKINTVLVTNGTPDLQWTKIQKSGIQKYFKHIVVSGDIGYKKPGKKIFEHCLEISKGSNETSLMIGDSLESDIKGANDMNIASTWINRNKKINNSEIKPQYEIKSLIEAIKIISIEEKI